MTETREQRAERLKLPEVYAAIVREEISPDDFRAIVQKLVLKAKLRGARWAVRDTIDLVIAFATDAAERGSEGRVIILRGGRGESAEDVRRSAEGA